MKPTKCDCLVKYFYPVFYTFLHQQDWQTLLEISSPTPVPKQGLLQQIAENCVQSGVEYL